MWVELCAYMRVRIASDLADQFGLYAALRMHSDGQLGNTTCCPSLKHILRYANRCFC